MRGHVWVQVFVGALSLAAGLESGQSGLSAEARTGHSGLSRSTHPLRPWPCSSVQ